MSAKCAKWLVLFLALGLIGPAFAVEFHGVIETFASEVWSDSINPVFEGGAQDTLRTPGWGGPPSTTDTFDFPELRSWPIAVLMHLRVAGGPPRIHPVGNPQPGVWFALPDGSGRVMFYGQVGVEEPGRPVEPGCRLSVIPSVVHTGAAIRTATPGIVEVADATGRAVRTMTVAGSAYWPGDDDDGRRLPAGIYFISLRAGRESAVRKILLAR